MPRTSSPRSRKPRTVDDIAAYLQALITFMTNSPAGAAYRALVGEAQHDPAVAALLAATDVLGDSARPVLERAIERGDLPPGSDDDAAVALLVGPVFYTVMQRDRSAPLSARALAGPALEAIRARSGRRKT